MSSNELQRRIDAAYDGPTLDPDAVEATIEGLDTGALRLAEPAASGPEWDVHAWIQRAILLYFGQAVMASMEVGPFTFHDKIPLKSDPAGAGIRVVPPATVRRGAFVEAGA
ncbi:MAG: 2,3,4,5-tetrahydropyridine-2,6-dicarboxylate N-succinyltransferase, partial [Gaiellales bacterium]